MLKNVLCKSLTIVSLSLPIVAFSSQNVLADRRDFTVHNRTSFPIVELYVSNSGQETWQEDVLEQDILEPGQSTLIYFTGSNDACLYDIKAIFSDGDTAEKYQINLCEIKDFDFHE